MSDVSTYLTAPPVPIGEMSRRSYAEYADRVAVIDGNRRRTYRQMEERATAVRRDFASSAASQATGWYSSRPTQSSGPRSTRAA
jgi:hypothetical protein